MQVVAAGHLELTAQLLYVVCTNSHWSDHISKNNSILLVYSQYFRSWTYGTKELERCLAPHCLIRPSTRNNLMNPKQGRAYFNGCRDTVEVHFCDELWKNPCQSCLRWQNFFEQSTWCCSWLKFVIINISLQCTFSAAISDHCNALVLMLMPRR